MIKPCALLGSLLLLLSGCVTAGFDEQVVEARFGPPEPHLVSGLEAPFDSILILGDVQDPVLTGGVVRDYLPNSGASYPTDDALAVDLYLDPSTWAVRSRFGPRQEAPAGVYRFAFPERKSGECGEYDRFIEQRSNAIGLSVDRCITYRYLSAKVDLDDRYILISYVAKVKSNSGLGIVVDEIRYGPSKVIARGYHCLAGPYVPYYTIPKICRFRSDDLVAFLQAATTKK